MALTMFSGCVYGHRDHNSDADVGVGGSAVINSVNDEFIGVVWRRAADRSDCLKFGLC